MGRRKREPMSEGKKNIIGMLLEEYDIRSAKDIEDALKDLLGGTIQEMLESEMDEHLGYAAYERSDNPDYRNGKKTKKIQGNFGETEIEVPQDRDGTFEPKIVKKRQKDISGIEQKIISLYAKGMTTRQISETIEDIYGFEVSDGMVSDITDRLLPQIEDWQKRPLNEVYPIVFIDAVHFSVRDNGQIKVSRSIKKTGAELLRESERWYAETGREARLSELAEKCGIVVMTTKKRMYEACGLLYINGLNNTKEA